MWDTSGQEKFNSLTSTYYQGAQGCLLIYDVTNKVFINNRNHFNQLKNGYKNYDKNAIMI